MKLPTQATGLNTTGLIYEIRHASDQDGPGLRTTIYFKGCPLDCWWCHEPESQSPMPEMRYLEKRCVRCGDCVMKCPIEAIDLDGNTVTIDREICIVCGTCVANCKSGARKIVGVKKSAEEVLAEIELDQAVFEQSGGGVTFSGGEPLMQHPFLMALLKGCKARGIHTALDTSGFAPWEIFESVLPYTDLFMFDIKMVDEERHIQFTGVSNELILQNLKTLSDLEKPLILRAPIISGINDDTQHLNDLCDLAAGLHLQSVEIIPYQPASEAQYESIAHTDRMPDLTMPSEENIQLLTLRLREAGISVSIIVRPLHNCLEE